ncbi:ATP-binding protein [Caldimonas tepidiphila]|uniref:ATP-binding protein n=1 Tax=Caldimonas tepidiphila TaxID=2315841 RepID=UPI000E5B5108|nr:ATP-binding protein [Caldimonas tepidiphila]
MMSDSVNPSPPGRAHNLRRVLLWTALVGLLMVAQTALVRLTLDYESGQAQAHVDEAASEAAGDIKRSLNRDLQSLQALMWSEPLPPHWRTEATELLRGRRELVRVEWRDAQGQVHLAVDSPYRPPVFSMMPRKDIDADSALACGAALRLSGPVYSRSYFVPQSTGMGLEAMDVCAPVTEGGRHAGFVVATYSLQALLSETVPHAIMQRHELSFIDGDGTRLARAGSMVRGQGVFVAQRLIDLPGGMLQLRVNSTAGAPDLIPNLATALVMGLSLALAAVVVLLVRDVGKRGAVERALGEALAFRKAMEDSLVTGLRARDLRGRITYVNPAFCEMVGFTPQELLEHSPPPYWPPEMAEEYARRQAARLSGDAPPRDGFETTFMRKNGERFPVVVYEAPLVGSRGVQTGWMSAVLDVSAQRRAEELSRHQQEKLQATARLATIGEMASLLSHELNQPLAAISSYATGSINLLREGPPDPSTLDAIRGAIERVAEQAERAGRIIKSVHNFVRRREQARETVRADLLLDAVLPLVRLQARKTGTRIELDLPVAPEPMPRVVCDRTMVEQVLLNLTRNAIQAMEEMPAAQRVLTLRVRRSNERWVRFSVIDRGAGVPEEVAQQLFTPFFTTKTEGMGLGLSLCRTVIEQHGGALSFENREPLAGGGTEFCFTLPAEAPAAARGAPRRAPAADIPTPSQEIR